MLKYLCTLNLFKKTKMESPKKDMSILCTLLLNQLNLINSSLKYEDKIFHLLEKEGVIKAECKYVL